MWSEPAHLGEISLCFNRIPPKWNKKFPHVTRPCRPAQQVGIDFSSMCMRKFWKFSTTIKKLVRESPSNRLTETLIFLIVRHLPVNISFKIVWYSLFWFTSHIIKIPWGCKNINRDQNSAYKKECNSCNLLRAMLVKKFLFNNHVIKTKQSFFSDTTSFLKWDRNFHMNVG